MTAFAIIERGHRSGDELHPNHPCHMPGRDERSDAEKLRDAVAAINAELDDEPANGAAYLARQARIERHGDDLIYSFEETLGCVGFDAFLRAANAVPRRPQ